MPYRYLFALMVAIAPVWSNFIRHDPADAFVRSLIVVSFCLLVGWVVGLFLKEKENPSQVALTSPPAPAIGIGGSARSMEAVSLAKEISVGVAMGSDAAKTTAQGDEQFFDAAFQELNSGNRVQGLWAKCFAEADGEENKAKARYLSARSKQLMVAAELIIEQERLDQAREGPKDDVARRTFARERASLAFAICRQVEVVSDGPDIDPILKDLVTEYSKLYAPSLKVVKEIHTVWWFFKGDVNQYYLLRDEEKIALSSVELVQWIKEDSKILD
jgi:hypothetical protein